MILNLTQHTSTLDQKEAGVIDIVGESKDRLLACLNFASIPTAGLINRHAAQLAELAEEQGFAFAMIGGAPFFMSALEVALHKKGIAPLYAFSERVSSETEVNGVVTKVNVFKHVGFIEIDAA